MTQTILFYLVCAACIAVSVFAYNKIKKLQRLVEMNPDAIGYISMSRELITLHNDREKFFKDQAQFDSQMRRAWEVIGEQNNKISELEKKLLQREHECSQWEMEVGKLKSLIKK